MKFEGSAYTDLANLVQVTPDDLDRNIATVALGSPVARQIVSFRRAKREFGRLTLGSAPLLEPMLNSYRQFSPLVAAEMQSDPMLRDAMLHYGVQRRCT